ncbi:hypothetical protein PR048_013556, partial [Dryococelus australis]
MPLWSMRATQPATISTLPFPHILLMETSILDARADGVKEKNGTMTVHNRQANNNVRRRVICTREKCEQGNPAGCRLPLFNETSTMALVTEDIEKDDLLGATWCTKHSATVENQLTTYLYRFPARKQRRTRT